MVREAGKSADVRPIVYCLVPRDLAEKAHERLRRHFRGEPNVRVVVEQRAHDRRSARDRRRGSGTVEPEFERRQIRSSTGRRIDDRRATAAEVDPPPLPPRLRQLAQRLVFFERLEPTDERLEDADTARIVTRIQAGEDELFATIYTRYFDRVYGYLRIALNDPHHAEDVTQQVFVKVLQGLPRYERRSQPFRAWLFAIVRNHALTQLQKLGRFDLVEPQKLARRGDLEQAGAASEALDWISDPDLLLFIERLPLPQRQVLLLRYMLDLTHEQTAAVLGKSTNEVRKTHQRALAFLRTRLAAVGRAPARGQRRDGCQRPLTQVYVLRERRFALMR